MSRASFLAAILSLLMVPLAGAAAEPLGSAHWEASFQVSDGHTRARLSLGKRTDATGGFDATHEVGLMAGDGVQAYFDRPGWPQTRYVRDIQGPGLPASWTVEVAATPVGSPMEVTWDLRFVPFGCERVDLTLHDPVTGATTDLRRASTFAWISDGSPRVLTVEATVSGGPAPAAPELISVLRPGNSGQVILRWRAPADNGVAVGGYDLFRTVNGETIKLNEQPISGLRFNDRLLLPEPDDGVLAHYTVQALSFELCPGPASEPRAIHQVGRPSTSTPVLPSTPGPQP